MSDITAPVLTPVQTSGDATFTIPVTLLGNSGYHVQGTVTRTFGTSTQVALFVAPTGEPRRVPAFDHDPYLELDWSAYPTVESVFTRIDLEIQRIVDELNIQIAAAEAPAS